MGAYAAGWPWPPPGPIIKGSPSPLPVLPPTLSPFLPAILLSVTQGCVPEEQELKLRQRADRADGRRHVGPRLDRYFHPSQQPSLTSP